MRHEEKEKQVTLPSSFVSIVHGLEDIYEVTEKRDVISFMTKRYRKGYGKVSKNQAVEFLILKSKIKHSWIAYLIQQGRTRHESITKN